MRIDRRLTLLGVMLVVLSTVMATQYATTKINFTYGIVHPSNADIRYIGSDNASDGCRVLRVEGSNSTAAQVYLLFGNWSAGTNKTYTAAFGIVNEEKFGVNITYINVSVSSPASPDNHDFMTIYLHGDRDIDATADATHVYMWNNGSAKTSANSNAWVFGKGDNNPSNMKQNASDPATAITNPWDQVKSVRYSLSDLNAHNATGVGKDNSVANASDFVWVQITLNIPQNLAANDGAPHTGIVWIHFKSNTHITK